MSEFEQYENQGRGQRRTRNNSGLAVGILLILAACGFIAFAVALTWGTR